MKKISLEIIRDTVGYSVDKVSNASDLMVSVALPAVTLTIDNTVSPPIHEFLLRVTVQAETCFSVFQHVEIDWGDGNTTDIPMMSTTFFDQITHNYEASGVHSIIVTVTALDDSKTVSDPLVVNATPSDVIDAEQYLIQRRQHTEFGHTYKVLDLVDWTSVSNNVHIDTLSDLNYSYRYRVKFRKLGPAGFSLNETGFSGYTVVN